MIGQSNHCLRVCNVKMKKNDRGRNAPNVREIFFDGPPHTSVFGLGGQRSYEWSI